MEIPKKRIRLKSDSINSLWIFKKDIKDVPKSIKSGDFVNIYSKNDKFLGVGYVNPKSKIFLRVIDFENISISQEYIQKKIILSFQKRKDLLELTDSIRIVHSEADFLPGLIIDKYKDIFVIQINTAGMESLRHFILSSLVNLFDPKSIYERSDKNMRLKEDLLASNGLIYGENVKNVIIEENNINFLVDFEKAQKTGFYLDQRRNRKIVSKYAKNKRVLDLFSHSGGFGIYCKVNGANFVKFVEISQEILVSLEKNLEINKVNDCCIIKEDVFKFLEYEDEKYDLIILDPPSFTKSKKEKKDAINGYKYLMIKCWNILNNNGILIVFSCSHYIGLSDLIDISKIRPFQILDILIQDIDHPFLSSIPNSFYLKGLILKKL